MVVPKIPPSTPDRIKGSYDSNKPQDTPAPAAKKVRTEGGYTQSSPTSKMGADIKETRSLSDKGVARFSEKPPLVYDDLAGTPDSKYATVAELEKRRDADGNPIPITFPITELATPAELAARKTGEAAQVALARKPKVKQGPRVHVTLHRPEPDTRAKKLIAADVPGPTPGISPEGYVMRPNIEPGHRFRIEGREIKADRFTNFDRMDPATRKSHIPEGKVMINFGREHLLVNRDDYDDISFLEANGGHVVAPD